MVTFLQIINKSCVSWLCTYTKKITYWNLPDQKFKVTVKTILTFKTEVPEYLKDKNLKDKDKNETIVR